MSYILNALRKSEKERQAIEPETVTARIVMHQAPGHQGSSRLIAALVVINLGVLAYFLGFRDRGGNDTNPSAVAAQAVAKPLEPGRAGHVPPRHALEGAEQSKESSIAKIMAARSAEPATPLEKPAVAKKQPAEALVRPAEAPVKAAEPGARPMVEPAKPAPQQPAVEPLEPIEDDIQPQKQVSAPIIEAAPAPAPAPAPKPAAVAAKSDLPFLDELPAEFGRSLPDLPINVFSYAPTPAERFVMIDMVKYVPGQRIKDQLELKEIRPDSIVVNYGGRTFKIKRP